MKDALVQSIKDIGGNCSANDVRSKSEHIWQCAVLPPSRCTLSLILKNMIWRTKHRKTLSKQATVILVTHAHTHLHESSSLFREEGWVESTDAWEREGSHAEYLWAAKARCAIERLRRTPRWWPQRKAQAAASLPPGHDHLQDDMR